MLKNSFKLIKIIDEINEYHLRYPVEVMSEGSSNLSSGQRWVKAVVPCISPWPKTQVV